MPDLTPKELFDETQKAFAGLKEYVERSVKEIKESGVIVPETKSAIDAHNSRLDELELKMKRPPASGNEDKDAKRTEEYKAAKDAWWAWARKGSVSPEQELQLKALTVQDDTGTGYLAMPEQVLEIIKGEILFSPVRTVCFIRTTSKNSIKIRKRTGVFAAKWSAEVGTRTETTGLTYGMEEIPTHEFYALVPISFQDLEDSDFNLEAELNSEVSEQFGVTEGTAVIKGSGVGQPEGLLTNTSIAHVASQDASVIKYGGLVDLQHTVPSPYAKAAVWLLNRKTLGAIRVIQDTANRYLWQPGLEMGNPPTILGDPYVECPDMPDIAGGAFPVIYGDVRRAYTLVDRLAVTVIRDPYSAKKSGAVEFMYRKRIGGQVVLAEAVRKLEIAAS